MFGKVASWLRPLPVCILLTSAWCPAKVMLWATPLFFHAKGSDCPPNHQPLAQWNKPSYYQHNRAYYRASVILVLLPSKTHIRLIKVRPSLPHAPFLLLNSCKVNVFGWCWSPSARATQPADGLAGSTSRVCWCHLEERFKPPAPCRPSGFKEKNTDFWWPKLYT